MLYFLHVSSVFWLAFVENLQCSATYKLIKEVSGFKALKAFFMFYAFMHLFILFYFHFIIHLLIFLFDFRILFLV